MVQSADDMGADHVRFIWRPEELLIAHDGKGVRLADSLLLGLPWLSGKVESMAEFKLKGVRDTDVDATVWDWPVSAE